MTQQSTVGVRVAARTPSPPGQLGPEPTPQTVPARRIRVSLSLLLGLALAVLLSVVHLAQGTADVRADDLLELLLGKGTERAADVAVASRLPRLLAGVVVGVCLGMAGAALQSVARNALASPDTLAVNAGAFLAVTAVAAAGFSLPVLASAGLAFVGGLAAAGLVLALSAGGSGPTRMVLAGSAIALALSALTSMMLLLFAQETRGLFAWGSGSLAQIGFGVLRQTAVLVVLGCAALLLLARRLDLLSLGDDTSSVLGVDPRRTRITAVVCTVLLSAVAVTVAGPIGFVGLCAPALVRLVAPAVPGLLHHRALLPMSALLGVVIVLGADVLLRASVGSVRSVAIPTGVATTLLGAVFLVVLATRRRDSGPTRHAPAARSARLRSRTSYSVLTGAVLALTAGAALLGSLLGDTTLLAGDVVNWLSGRAGPGVSFVLETRMPRVTAALLAGAALALAGATIQAVCRNPLAEPGIIGVAGGAGLGAVLSITLVAGAGAWTIAGSALVGAVGASALVFGVAARGGLQADRLVLVGVGVSAAGRRSHHLPRRAHRPVQRGQGDHLAERLDVRRDVRPSRPARANTRADGPAAGRTMSRPRPVGARRRHPAGARRAAGADSASPARRRNAADCLRRCLGRRHRLRGAGRTSRGPRDRRQPSYARPADRDDARRDRGEPWGHLGAHGGRTGSAARRAAHCAHRHAVLRVAAMAIPRCSPSLALRRDG